MQKHHLFSWGAAALCSALFLSGCSKSAPPPPYANRSAAWLAETKHTMALKTELTWCAKNNPGMSDTLCKTAKKAYVKIGGHWNSRTIGLLRGGST